MEASAYGDFGACSQPGGFQYSPLRPAFPAAGPPCPALGSSNCALGALRDHQPAPYSAGEPSPGPTLPANPTAPPAPAHSASGCDGPPQPHNLCPSQILQLPAGPTASRVRGGSLGRVEPHPLILPVPLSRRCIPILCSSGQGNKQIPGLAPDSSPGPPLPTCND